MKTFFFTFTELANLTEQEFGIESTAMYDDLRAPSVPVQPVNMGTRKVSHCLKYIYIELFIIFIRIMLRLMNMVYQKFLQ